VNEKYKQRTFWFAVGLEVIWGIIALYAKVDPELWLNKAMYIGAAWGVLDVTGNKLPAVLKVIRGAGGDKTNGGVQ